MNQLRGRKTDVEDSRWLARVCQLGLGRPSLVPERQSFARRPPLSYAMDMPAHAR